jgi:hypothetical protein
MLGFVFRDSASGARWRAAPITRGCRSEERPFEEEVSMSTCRIVPLLIAVAALPLAAVAGDFDTGFEPGMSAGGLYSDGGSSGGLQSVAERLDALSGAASAPTASVASAIAPLTLGDGVVFGSSYVVGKAGPMWFYDDLSPLDVGVNFNLTFGHRILPFLAIEIESGYFWTELEESSAVEFWGVPLLVNAKVIIPLAILEVYAGVGIGGFYLEIEEGPNSEDDIVFGGDAFVGANLKLGPVLLGVEAKYYLAQEFDLGTIDPNLSALAVMVVVGVDF